MGKILVFILRGIAHMPWKGLYIMSDMIYGLMYYVIGYRKKVVRENLRNSFPDYSVQELKTIEKKFYHHLCDIIVESIKLLHISDDEIRERVKYTNTELQEKIAEDGRSMILFIGHLGNWEWVQSIAFFCKRPEYLMTLYKPIKSKTMNYVVEQIRSRFSIIKVESQKALRTLLKYHNDHKQFFVAFIADQRTASRKHAMTFMGQKSTYYTGGEDIGKHLNTHMLYLDIEKPSRGHYVMTYKNLDDTVDMSKPYPYTHAFMAQLEANIRRQPELWMWSHNRWKNNHKIEVEAE